MSTIRKQHQVIIDRNKFPRKDRNKSLAVEMRRHEKDTGSFEAQIAFLTERIINLSAYIQRNPADDIAKRGLYRYLSKRRRILSAMKQKEPQKYEEAVEMISSLAGMK